MYDLRNYALVTGAYWGFTLTDGALRMLVLLHFHQLGYTPTQIALLFLFYEFFGIVTNLVGGWVGSHFGLRTTLFAGLSLQVGALAMLALLDPAWPVTLSVAYVMSSQALSGIAKDLTKMSSKSAIKQLVPDNAESILFKWVAILTGSKNALKGAGFFLGGLLLTGLGFQGALLLLAAGLLILLVGAVVNLPKTMGQARHKVKFAHILSKNRNINLLSAARLFLFGSRDIWFVVGLPIFLSASLHWSHTKIGGFLALWVIGYGIIQAMAPTLVKMFLGNTLPGGGSATIAALVLAGLTAIIATAVQLEFNPWLVVVGGLALFGVVFAINSAIHSYLILAYSSTDQVALDVGFYYMANASGRLLGTLLSGIAFEFYALPGCLWISMFFILAAAAFSIQLPRKKKAMD